jgi:hypothetical protein
MKQSKKENKNKQGEQIIWSNAEEEIFDEVCLFYKIKYLIV